MPGKNYAYTIDIRLISTKILLTSKKIEDKKNHLLEAQKHLAKAKKIKSVMGDMRNSEDWNYG